MYCSIDMILNTWVVSLVPITYLGGESKSMLNFYIIINFNIFACMHIMLL